MEVIVWDWNGTLFDDVPVCVEVENRLLARRGLPLLTVERYREIFTFPVEEYYRAAGLDLEREPFPALAEEYIAGYHAAAEACGLYPGAGQVLEQLRRGGWRQILVSASEKGALAAQVESRGIRGCFEAVLGIGDVLAAGKAGLAGEYLRREGIAPAGTVFVGDTLHDWEVAEELGCRCLLIAGGHQSRARLAESGAEILEDITQVPEALGVGRAIE